MTSGSGDKRKSRTDDNYTSESWTFDLHDGRWFTPLSTAPAAGVSLTKKNGTFERDTTENFERNNRPDSGVIVTFPSADCERVSAETLAGSD
jgi:hypothetical protein